MAGWMVVWGTVTMVVYMAKYWAERMSMLRVGSSVGLVERVETAAVPTACQICIHIDHPPSATSHPDELAVSGY